MMAEILKTAVLAAGLFLAMILAFAVLAVVSVLRPPGGYLRAEREGMVPPHKQFTPDPDLNS